ncbi:hypothetical protein [Scatolibacter rhodanostii]|uniref:hypothetical protein n=1 Tax=Scatolibacter rhodanostii TaxID=2014781 RepID=UPI000C074A63|nr:hypothetical protein [Scatolibacter rhodanostii]
MKTATIISAIITVLLLLSTMVCGLWIRANQISDLSSLDFHMYTGISAVLFSILTLCLGLVTLSQTKKKG